MSDIHKRYDDLTGVATLQTEPRLVFEQKSGFISTKPGASISVNLMAVSGPNGTEIGLIFREVITNATLPETGTLHLLIDGERFQFKSQLKDVIDSGASTGTLEIVQIPLEVLEKIARCIEFRTRVRGIDLEITFPFVDDAQELLELINGTSEV